MSWGAAPWGATQWGGGGAVGPCFDAVAPVIDNFAPDEGVAIGRTDPIAFDVWDNSGQFAAVVVLARYLEEGACECAFNGISYEARYAAGSARVPIINGYRYTVRRTGGWLGTPLQLVIIAIDGLGNVTRREIGFG